MRERPRGGGSRSATHPAYQTALGEGIGRRRQPALRPSSLLPRPQPLPADTQRAEGGTERRRNTQRGKGGGEGRPERKGAMQREEMQRQRWRDERPGPGKVGAPHREGEGDQERRTDMERRKTERQSD